MVANAERTLRAMKMKASTGGCTRAMHGRKCCDHSTGEGGGVGKDPVTGHGLLSRMPLRVDKRASQERKSDEEKKNKNVPEGGTY